MVTYSLFKRRDGIAGQQHNTGLKNLNSDKFGLILAGTPRTDLT